MNLDKLVCGARMASAATLLGAFGAADAAASAPAAPRPHIVWLVCEDVGPLMPPYGFGQVHTPHINQLAAEGIVYDNAFAPAPVCAPSRFALITGRHASAHPGAEGMRGWHDLAEPIKFFPEFLRQQNYYTASWGKTDYNTGRYNGGSTDLALKAAWNDEKFIWAPLGDDAPARGPHWRNRPDPTMPFFQMFNIVSTHENFLFPAKRPASPRHDPAAVVLPPYHPDTPTTRTDWAFLLDRIEEVDDQVGGVLEDLREDGALDDAIIFFFSDHGGNLMRTKRYLLDSGTRVPLIVWFGKNHRHLAPRPPGSRIDHPVSLVDLPPSVLNLLGLPIPSYMHGRPVLGDSIPEPRTHVFLHRQRMGGHIDLVRGVGDGRFLHLRNYLPRRPQGPLDGYRTHIPSQAEWNRHYGKTDLPLHQRAGLEAKPFEQLFDTLRDPHNLYDMASNPAYQPVLARMRRALDAQMKETEDVGLYWTYPPDSAPLDDVMRAAALAARADPAQLPGLRELLGSETPVLRFWALHGMAELATLDPASMVALRPVLDDPDPLLRIVAAEILARHGQVSDALPLFREALLHRGRPDPSPALWALNAVAIVGLDKLASLRPQLEEIAGQKGHEAEMAKALLAQGSPEK